MLLGSKDLAEKNLLQYKDVFSDIVNVNLFGGRHYISANELSREPGELITKSSSDNKLKQLQMDIPMKCNKKYNTRFFVCLENQSDINNIMPVRDMGYQHAKYMEQVRTIKETNRQQQAYPSPITKEIHDAQKLDPVITLVLNYSQKEWKKPKQLQDVLNIPDVQFARQGVEFAADHLVVDAHVARNAHVVDRELLALEDFHLHVDRVGADDDFGRFDLR